MEKQSTTTVTPPETKAPRKNGTPSDRSLSAAKFQTAKRKVLAVHENLLRRLAK